MTASVSRRTVTRGAAWAVPVVATAAAAPAVAATSPEQLAYRLRASWYTRYQYGGYYQCYNNAFGRYGYNLTFLEFNNQTPPSGSTSPRGFTIINDVAADGSTSPTTTATVQSPLTIELRYPTGMVSTGANTCGGWQPTTASRTNWGCPTVQRNVWDGSRGLYYDVFTFTWRGNPTQATVTNSSPRPTSWQQTELAGTWAVNTSYCAPDRFSWYYGMTGSFTTANGFTGQIRESQWIPIQGTLGG